MTPLDAAAAIISAFYWLAAVGLVVFGAYYLVIVALRLALPPSQARAKNDAEPSVTVQIPVRNERYVIERCLRAAAALEWPRDRLEIQVLDDSDDDTCAIIDRLVVELRGSGLTITVLRRPDHAGFKAGALNHGLATARGELVAIFDADFLPPPDFLRRTAPFATDSVACVQTRWAHLNESTSLLTRSIAIALDAHFTVEQEVRSRYGLLMSFNATACVWRRSALEALGGWPTATATEDLELTIKTLASGKEIVYLDEPRVPCEIPAEILGFAKQQARWALGGAQNLAANSHLLRAPRFGFWRRVDAAFHLSHYGFQCLVVLLFLVTLATAFLGAPVSPAVSLTLAVGAMLGPLLLLIEGQRRTHPRGWPLRLWRIAPLTLFGIGVSLRVALAFLHGLRTRRWSFFRTPKYNLHGHEGTWRRTPYVPTTDAVTFIEGLFAASALLGSAAALDAGRYGVAASLVAFAVAYAWVFVQSLTEQRGRSGPDRVALSERSPQDFQGQRP